MREIPLHDHAGLSTEAFESLRRQVTAQRTLADVLRWAAGQAPPVTVAEIVTQDEYTHDVVLPVDGTRAWYLAHDTT